MNKTSYDKFPCGRIMEDSNVSNGNIWWGKRMFKIRLTQSIRWVIWDNTLVIISFGTSIN